MQRTYEIMFIVRPDVSDEDVDRLVSTLEGHIGNAGGAVKSVERMGKRRLAYLVRNFHDGNYVLFTVEGPGTVIAEAERRLRVAEPVIKFITVRVDEEQKRLDKVRKIRESRVRNRPQPAAAPATEGTETTAPGEQSAPVTA